MALQERIIVPALGVIVLLAALTMGAPLLYKALLGLLGLAAVGTWFAPSVVQVETRAGIAVLGLLVLILYFNSLSFWLALLSFGAIGALQIRHRDALQKNPATVTWLRAALARRGGGNPAGDAASSGLVGVLQRRVHVAGIGGVILGIAVLFSPFMPWAMYTVTFEGETEAVVVSALTAAEIIEERLEEGTPLTNVIFGAGIVLALLSMASMCLHRAVLIIVGFAGMVLTLYAFIYVFVGFIDRTLPSYVSQFTYPHIGFFVTGGSFLLITVLHIVPAASRPIGGKKSGD